MPLELFGSLVFRPFSFYILYTFPSLYFAPLLSSSFSVYLSSSASFLLFFLTTRFFHLTTLYQIVLLLSLVRMFLKSKQTIQTCRIRKYIILHNIVSYVTAGLISVDCLLFDSSNGFILCEKEKFT